MGLSGGANCIKYLMFVFNFIFFLMGCGILGLGIWLKVEKGDYVEITDYDYITAANIIIAAGAIILIVSFFGCCGAIKEIPLMLLGFFVMMLIIFILEVTAGGLAYAKRGDLEDKLEKEFNESIRVKYGEPNEDGVTKAIDKFQESFHCCGYNNFNDYRSSAYTKRTATLPKSCCTNQKDASCGGTLPGDIHIYEKKGCFKEVKEFLKDNLLYIGACAIAFAVIQILGMVFAMMLYCAVQKDKGGTFA